MRGLFGTVDDAFFPLDVLAVGVEAEPDGVCGVAGGGDGGLGGEDLGFVVVGELRVGYHVARRDLAAEFLTTVAAEALPSGVPRMWPVEVSWKMKPSEPSFSRRMMVGRTFAVREGWSWRFVSVWMLVIISA